MPILDMLLSLHGYTFKVSKPEVLHIKMNHKTYNIHHVETEPSEGGVPGGQLL